MKGVIYQIWYKHKCKLRKTFLTPSYVEVNEATGTWDYPLVKVLDSFPRLSRGDVICKDRVKLEPVCTYLNEMAGEDEFYYIRAVELEQS
jgi:hypothetical protein